jgi:membrane protein DedA with SNARE-associated domain
LDLADLSQSLGSWGTVFIDWVRANQRFLAPAVFLLAFLESIAFVSLLVPSTIILMMLGVLIGAGDLPFWPAFVAAVVGAFLGDWLSYFIGYRFRNEVKNLWPLSRHPEMFVRGEDFFLRYGAPGYFVGRFVGPLRAVFPLICGISSMRYIVFQSVNAASAVLWAGVYLGAGVSAGRLVN